MLEGHKVVLEAEMKAPDVGSTALWWRLRVCLWEPVGEVELETGPCSCLLKELSSPEGTGQDHVVFRNSRHGVGFLSK